MFRLKSAVCVLIIAGWVVSTETAPQLLREWAKAQAQRAPGEPLKLLGPLGDYSPKTVAQLTREADIVFQARIFKLETYIGNDGERVLTDYAIREQQLLAGRTANAVARAFDASKPLVVTMYGGEITIEGVQVQATPSDRSNVVDGGEYILFLMPSRGGADRYEPYHAGIFAVDAGKVKPLHRDSSRLFKDAVDAPLARVLLKIEQARLF